MWRFQFTYFHNSADESFAKSCSTHDYDATAESDGHSTGHSNFHCGSNRHLALHLSVEQERKLDQRGNFGDLYDAGDE
jgi:hypothetical protein